MAGVCAYCMACVCRGGDLEHTRLLCRALESFGDGEIAVRVREEILLRHPSLLGERGVEGGGGEGDVGSEGGGGEGGGGGRGGDRAGGGDREGGGGGGEESGSERKGVGREKHRRGGGGGGGGEGWEKQKGEEISVQEDTGGGGRRSREGSYGRREEYQEEEVTEAVLSLCGCLLNAVKRESKVAVREELVEDVVSCVLLLLQTHPVTDSTAQSFLDSLVEVRTCTRMCSNCVWVGSTLHAGTVRF